MTLEDDKKSVVKISDILQNSEFHNPSFYKIVLPGTDTCGVRIPPEFLEEHMEEETSGGTRLTTTLKVTGKEFEWRVKLIKEENDLVFGEGWGIFYEDNSLKLTNLLVFTYLGDLKFNVDVFDRSGILS